MNLVEGVKWSDGDPFDTEDIDFWWNDNVQNANVNSRLPKDTLGAGTTVDITQIIIVMQLTIHILWLYHLMKCL